MDNVEALIDAAWRARREGRYQEAELGLHEAIEASRRSGNGRQLTAALGKLAHVMRDLDRHDEALRFSEEAVGVSRGTGDGLLLAHAVRHLGDVHRDARRLADADACYTEALELYRAADGPDSLDVANALRPAALLKVSQGKGAEALALFSEARTLYQQAGIEAGVEECSRNIAKLGGV
jgi:tetratricopeptide (TPR) repeat protein